MLSLIRFLCVRLTWLASSLFQMASFGFELRRWRLKRIESFFFFSCRFVCAFAVGYLWSTLGQQVANVSMILHECRDSNHTCEPATRKKKRERNQTETVLRLSSNITKVEMKKRTNGSANRKKYKIAITNEATELNRFDYIELVTCFCFWMKHMWHVKLVFLCIHFVPSKTLCYHWHCSFSFQICK